MEFDYLITSAFGFGEKLILELLRRGESVFAIYPTPKDVPMSFLGKKNIKYGFIKFEHDPILSKTLPRKVKHIIHIFDVYSGRFSKMFKANTLATLLLLDWAKNVEAESFTYFSSGEVYGTGKEITEGSRLEPHGFYATTKYQAEMFFRFYQRAMRINTIRVFFPFGNGIEQGFVYELARALKSGGPIEPTYNLISPTFGDDIVTPLLNIHGLKKSGVYNLCGSPVNVDAVVEQLGKIIGKSPNELQIGKDTLTGNNKVATEKLGYVETPIADALERAFKHMR
ncbi:MAG: NAD(P)-dependent oxidoreductase [candidate division WOR-3 bacterium]|nr:MAG: NAD(P)-dependent oxidoreductase [candidate division WOR-3 bacterium]